MSIILFFLSALAAIYGFGLMALAKAAPGEILGSIFWTIAAVFLVGGVLAERLTHLAGQITKQPPRVDPPILPKEAA